MFPPMTPMGERIRIEFETGQLEQEAALRAQMAQDTNWLEGVRRALASLWPRKPESQPRPRAAEQQPQC